MLLCVPDARQGAPGAGVVHHVAFRARTQDEQHGWQERLASAGHRTTEVIDRQYFNAIYFREPGGVLFEVATIRPGFTVDEELRRRFEARFPGSAGAATVDLWRCARLELEAADSGIRSLASRSRSAFHCGLPVSNTCGNPPQPT